MKETPIFFKGPLVRAILDGRKTMTRRILKPQPEWKEGQGMCADGWAWEVKKVLLEHWPDSSAFSERLTEFCPYGTVGDRLWVRETFYNDIQGGSDIDHVYYPADAKSKDWCCELIPECCCCEVGKPKLTPSILMPRWASRITLEITAIKVERLNEMSEDDAVAEGCERVDDTTAAKFAVPGPIYRFRELWESINGKGAWQQNPWVFSIEFRKL